jgi:hypothetical protein
VAHDAGAWLLRATVPVGPPALRFALLHRATIFPGVPLVFVAAREAVLADLPLPPDITGMWMDRDWRANVELILRLHPDTRRIAFVSGGGTTPSTAVEFKRVAERFRDRFEPIELDGVNQIDYLSGKTEKSAREVFFYYSGATLSALRYKNWKFYWTMPNPSAEGWLLPKTTYNFTLVDNIKRDPFEAAVGPNEDTVMSMGGALAAPMTAFIYDWNLLPLGQLLALQFLETYAEYPPLQAPSSYNLEQVMQEIEAQKRSLKGAHPSD